MMKETVLSVNVCSRNIGRMKRISFSMKGICCSQVRDIVSIEIKQNQEDMGEENDIKPYDKYFSNGTVSNTDNLPKSNLKPFDIQKAREGKPVCTRDGRKTRILCYDFKQNEEYPILVAVENKDGKECALLYSNDGISEMYKSSMRDG